jgi:hypothetical protein
MMHFIAKTEADKSTQNHTYAVVRLSVRHGKRVGDDHGRALALTEQRADDAELVGIAALKIVENVEDDERADLVRGDAALLLQKEAVLRHGCGVWSFVGGMECGCAGGSSDGARWGPSKSCTFAFQASRPMKLPPARPARPTRTRWTHGVTLFVLPPPWTRLLGANELPLFKTSRDQLCFTLSQTNFFVTTLAVPAATLSDGAVEV